MLCSACVCACMCVLVTLVLIACVLCCCSLPLCSTTFDTPMLVLQGDELLQKHVTYEALRKVGVAAHLDLRSAVEMSAQWKAIKPTVEETGLHKASKKKSKWKPCAKLTAVHQRLLDKPLENAHSADADVKGMMAVAQLEWIARLIIAATAAQGAASWSQVQLRAEGLAVQYAASHFGYSRAPYGRCIPICRGHHYPMVVKQSWSEKNPGRWYAACNSAHDNKPEGPSRKCSDFRWLTPPPDVICL